MDPTSDPYDVCIDTFERGMRADVIRPLFAAVKPVLVEMIAKIHKAYDSYPFILLSILHII
jgi:Zn-dependent M32 family carboxypeptidase